MLIAFRLAIAPVFAASAVSKGFEPGQIERQVEEPPVAVPAPVRGAVPDAAKARDEMREQSFVLSGVLIEGATVYRTIEFLPFYQGWLGKQVTVKILTQVAADITRHYRTDGYFLSSAFLPAQTIEYGIVRIRVVEGYVAKWTVVGASLNGDPLLRRMLGPLLAQRPLRRPVLESVFQNLAALQDVNLRPEVRPIVGQIGAYELLLKAEIKRYDGSISLDNHGSEFIGPHQGVVTLRAFDLSGHHESYQLRLATAAPTSEIKYAEASTEWLLTPEGLRLQAGIAHTVADPGGGLEVQRTHVENERLRIGFMYPLVRLSSESKYLGVVLSRYHSRTDLLGVKRLEDRLTSVTISYHDFWQRSQFSAHSLSILVAQGISIAGSKVQDTQSANGVGRTDFSKLAFSYAYHQRFRPRWILSAAVDGQYAFNALPAAERYSIGGSQFGRAYDPSEISADHGLAGRIELAWKKPDEMSGWRKEPYGFYDLGAVWPIAHTSQDSRSSVASLGFGARVARAGFTAFLELAKPLTRPVASAGYDGRDARVFAGLAYRF